MVSSGHGGIEFLLDHMASLALLTHDGASIHLLPVDMSGVYHLRITPPGNTFGNSS